jgi:hypothetical protein
MCESNKGIRVGEGLFVPFSIRLEPLPSNFLNGPICHRKRAYGTVTRSEGSSGAATTTRAFRTRAAMRMLPAVRSTSNGQVFSTVIECGGEKRMSFHSPRAGYGNAKIVLDLLGAPPQRKSIGARQKGQSCESRQLSEAAGRRYKAHRSPRWSLRPCAIV